MESIKSPAEHRVILHNTSWETYERLMKERGESRVPRFAYDRGDLEIMSPSTERECIAYLYRPARRGFRGGGGRRSVRCWVHDLRPRRSGTRLRARCLFLRSKRRACSWQAQDRSEPGSTPGSGDRGRHHEPLPRQVPHLRSSKHPRDLAPRRRKAGDLRAARQRVRRGRREQDPPPSHERSPLQLDRGEHLTRYRDLDAPGARVVAGQYRVV
jgi:hypothetical protein